MFEAAFSCWVVSRSAVVRQQRGAFERECNAPWQRDAFADWLSADAKGKVCAELRLLRDAFVKELEAVGEIEVTPQRLAKIVRHVGHFVRRAKWWSRGRATAKGSHFTDYQDDRRRSREAIQTTEARQDVYGEDELLAKLRSDPSKPAKRQRQRRQQQRRPGSTDDAP
jgi:hypothetical protein